MSHLRKFQIALVVIAIATLSVALWDLVFGGFYFRVIGLRVSSWDVRKPFRIGMVAAVAAICFNDWLSDPAEASWNAIVRRGRWIAAAAATTSAAIAVHYGIFVAGGSDAYGYVSQASLWAHGQLSTPDPLAAVATLVGPAAGTLGYQLASTPGLLVPTYPAGFPLAMAIAMKLAGPSAAYFVVPFFAGLVVWFTYMLAVRIADARTGVIAAILVASSPIFIFQSLEPMSDVPVTAWWLLAWLLALSRGGGAAFASGVAVSAAVLTRPNLVPLALMLAIVAAGQAPRWRRATLFVAGVIPGCLAVAALNAIWYGSPLASGYGALNELYMWDRALPNLRHYLSWLTEQQSQGILLAVVTPLVARAKPEAAAMLVFVAGLLGCYLFYFVYDSWPFLRFLLPGIPLLIVLASSVVVWILTCLPIAVRGALLFLICTLMPIGYLLTANSLHILEVQQSEHRYMAIGEYVGATLPANAVVLTVIQSGSVRLYGRRPTLRWDLLPADRLDQTLDGLRAAGYDPYLLLEDWEDDLFRARFGTTSVVGNADWQSAIEYYGSINVRILRPADRDAYFSGRRVLPRAVPHV